MNPGVSTNGICGNKCPCEDMQANIEDRLRSEERLRRVQSHLALAQEVAAVGSWDWEVATDIVVCSPELRRICGVPEAAPAFTFGDFMEFVHPEDRKGVKASIEKCCAAPGVFSYYHRIVRADGKIRMIHGNARVLTASDGAHAHVTGTTQDVTERVLVEKTLAVQAEELRRSNIELRRFAYVASHDLQEPLRTVASFTRLLQQRYAGRLDAEADEMIDFAVDGAGRMQALIESLLSYFRVDRRELVIGPVDSHRVLQEALKDLHVALGETGAMVTASTLPVVYADSSLLGELFQNLIGNAVKYRSARSARVRIAAVRSGLFWRFAVWDNGIGIDRRHHDRVFEIFQRLHTREEFEGMGIGLAICKKIVERHGGRIWIDSTAGHGAAFYFTMPAAASVSIEAKLGLVPVQEVLSR